jgi:gamma-glutamylcyclotransferase (GGCT)/AIG2-like uncharacterized protein YtfP
MALYIAYGSNLNKRQMAYRCPTARYVGSTVIDGYELLFRGHYGSAVATIEPKENSSVPIGLWKIGELDEKALDSYEGYPRLYRKEIISVKLNKKKQDAMVYIMNDGRPINLPSRYYFNVISEGYLDCGLDREFLVNSLQDTIKRANIK